MNLTRFQREFEPRIRALQEALTTVIGHLLWKEPHDARLVTHTERQDFVRVGPMVGDGVALETIDPDAVLEAFNATVTRLGFPPAPAITAVDGELACTADDQIGTTLELRIGGDVRIWMDTESLAE